METSDGSFPESACKGDVREETLFVKTGTDLPLDVGKPVPLKEHESMSWKFNSTTNIGQFTGEAKPEPLGNYAGRAELFPQNRSLLLKDVQKTDSGEYKAVFSGDKDITLVKYQVIVQDPVSDVKLEGKNCSSDRSDLNVTCTTGNDLLTFICENTTCSHDGAEQTLNIPPGTSMNVTRTNDFVTCRHSNQVSFTEDTKTVENLCDPVRGIGAGAFAAVAAVAVFLVAGAVLVYHFFFKGKDLDEGPEGKKAKQKGDVV